jgi:hypothetical protein
MKRLYEGSVALLLLIGAMTGIANRLDAQAVTGSLAGSVVDATGAVLPGVTVTLISEENNAERTTTTDASGSFVFVALRAGRYTIKIEAAGFRPFVRTGGVVQTGERLVVGALTLQLGEVTETVSVTAQGVGVQTETTNNSALLDSKQVALQGLRGRDPVSMFRLLPGVEQGRVSDMLGGSFGTEVPRFMGKTNNTIYVDGVNGGDGGGGGNFSGAVNPEAIEEISVQMTNYTAEYGRGGGPQINIVTKSGGVDYHGKAYWFKRHEMFNAQNFFSNLNGLAKPRVRFTNIGGTLGGPVPLLNGAEKKLFFFYSFDWTGTKRTEAIRRWMMPTALERQGNFSQTFTNAGQLIVVRDPDNGNTPFPSNIVPQSRRDPYGAAIMNILPMPNISGQQGYNFITQWEMPHPRRQNLFKIDYRPNTKDSFSFKGSTWWLHQQGFEAPGSHTADARWGFIEPRLNFDGRFPLTGADTTLPVRDDLTYIRGAHTFKFGFQWEKAAFRQARASNFTGEFNFQHNANNPRSSGFAYANAFLGNFDSYAEDLGRVGDDRVQIVTSWYAQDAWKVHRRLTMNVGLRMYHWGRDLQQGGEASAFSVERFDPSWGGNPPVLFRPVSTANGRRAQNPRTGEILPANYIGTIVPGTGYSCTKPQNLKNPCLINGIVLQENGDYVSGGRGFVEPLGVFYDPRIGLAWDVFGNSKTALRASWGVYHVAASGADRSFNFRQGGPSFEFNQQIVYGDIANMLNATPVTNPTAVNGTFRLRNKELNYQYTFGIQHELGWNTILDVAYVGNTSRHRPLTWNYNLLPQGVRFRPENRDPSQPVAAPNAANPGALPDNFLRPYTQGFANIDMTGNGGTDRYDSLQVQLNRRFTGGFEIATAYTYANGLQKGWYQQLNITNLDRNTDIQTHMLSVSYVIDVPKGSRFMPNAFGKTVLDNWQLSGVTTFASGKPQNVTLQTSDNFDFTGGGESCGVVQTGPAILPRGERGFNRWFDTSVFQRPSGRGDIGNNCQNYKFRGPGINNWDIAVFKNIPIGEGSKKFQFRWEMYNLFNHTQFDGVNNTARFNPAGQQINAQFGFVTSARQERRMQGALRFEF